MATLKSIRKRITSVKNTQKITKAMKMVAAAKLRRAQQAVVAVRPYANRLSEIVDSLASTGIEMEMPFFVGRPAKKALVIIYTSNRGLCGGFNSNLLRRTETQIKMMGSTYEKIELFIIGKKGRDFFRARKREPESFVPEYADKMTFVEAADWATKLMNGYSNGEYDECYIAFNGFKSALSQDVTIKKIIPYSHKEAAPVADSSQFPVLNLVEPIYEPGKEEALNLLIPKHLAIEIYRAHKESQASELGARMTAMDNATSNAKEMIKGLTLQYNRLRQAAITKELMDIVNGAESIK